MKLLVRYLKPFRVRMAIGFCIKAGGTMVELMLPYILSYILKNVVGSRSVPQILAWGGLMILCAATACICNIVANRMAARSSADFSEQLRKDLFAKTLRLSAAQTDRFTIPSLESRITTDTYHVHSFVSMMQRMGVRAPILLLGGIVITLVMDAYLALVMLAALPLICVTVFLISNRGVPLYARVQQSVDNMVRVVREDFQGIRVIKALSKNDYENRRYDAVNRRLSRDETFAGTIMGIANPAMTLLMNCGITAVVAWSAYRVAGHQSDPETVIAFMQYFTLISMAMMSISRIFVMYTKCAASSRRIGEVLEQPEEIFTPEKQTVCEPRREDAHIVFENVGFSYTGKHRHLKNINVSVPRGGSLGIIGATGSGKSTLVKLLMRFYDVTEGEIRINGLPLSSYGHQTLSGMFGVALQNDFLYADTVEENIRFGRELSHDAIVNAARIAQADDFITAFADGYGHLVSSKGTNLSGGQRQRLLIARAIAGMPEILVLDDSSSALDYKTDANLRRALAEELTNTTVVTVAQRVSSIKDCSVILVLEHGRVIGQGTHDELMRDCPAYREISDSQMGGAFVE
ncbi:MAG: ABC transporter ATP-binding protein [Clostridia bacterium]|nr:ABC transporter ATP-binding protein [Clostridia bacterium]